MFYFSKTANQKHPHALFNIAFNAKFRNHSVKLCTPKLSKLYDKKDLSPVLKIHVQNVKL